MKSVSSKERLREGLCRQPSSSSGQQGVSSKLYRSMDLLEEAVPGREKLAIRHSFRTRAGRLASNPGKVNQDVQFVHMHLQGKKHLLAVGDGHGQFGHEVSGLVKRRFADLLLGERLLATAPVKALSRAFERVESELRQSGVEAELSGSTLVVALVEELTLYTANVGDSRAILCRRKGLNSWEVSDVTRDHKPCLEGEKARIRRAGGRVECFRDEFGQKVGPERVWARHQNSPGLAMSRSIGDFLAKSVGVSCVPDVMRFSLQAGPQFLMLASDGIWDYLTKEEVAHLVVPFFEQDDVEGACDLLLEEAYARWTEEDDEVVDDITFVLAFMHPT